MGVWIEIPAMAANYLFPTVTPYMGVWIEIYPDISLHPWELKSLPIWECGLKCWHPRKVLPAFSVTPYMGVWIEIYL